MDNLPHGYASARKRPNPWVIAGVAVLHLGIFYGLIRALAPGAVQSVENSVVAAFSVTVTAPEPPPPPPPEAEPEPDEGAQGDPGRDAVPAPVAAPTPEIRLREDPPAPRATATGTAPSSGVQQAGEGTGAAGSGQGTGSGRGGQGRGGIVATRPVKTAGDINAARDFPIPDGGRQARFGTSVTVAMTVGVDGRARDCRVVRPSPDPQADAIVCQLAIERFRFRPAIDTQGNPVPADYGWRQDWFAR
ncbi:MAG: energy transducer TonB [Alphaproteobacteria bacterium]|nr:energy transducer TonB [Alphaproteobacteria bacterium]